MDIINRFSAIHTTAKPGREIKYIVVHYTAGVTSRAGSAINTAEYYRTTDREVSADYTVDDTSAVCYNGDINNRYTWHCGGSRYSTKGGSFYGKCTNANAIGVEICSTNSIMLCAPEVIDLLERGIVEVGAPALDVVLYSRLCFGAGSVSAEIFPPCSV